VRPEVVAEDVAEHVHYGDRISEGACPAVRQVIRAERAEPLAGGGRGHLFRTGIPLRGIEEPGAVVPLKKDDRRHLGGPKDLADCVEQQPVDALHLLEIGSDVVDLLLAIKGPALAVEHVGVVRLQDMGEGEDRPAGARQGSQPFEGPPGVVRLPAVIPVEVAQDAHPPYPALQLAARHRPQEIEPGPRAEFGVGHGAPAGRMPPQ
jgi:hypothetical protein